MNGNWYSRKNLQTWFVLLSVTALAWFKDFPPEYVVAAYAMALGIYGYFNVKGKVAAPASDDDSGKVKP